MLTAKELFENKFNLVNSELARAARGESISEFPFPLDYHDGLVWLQSQQSALQWVLEMMD